MNNKEKTVDINNDNILRIGEENSKQLKNSVLKLTLVIANLSFISVIGMSIWNNTMGVGRGFMYLIIKSVVYTMLWDYIYECKK